jgi:hypothetical protein
MTTQAKIQQLKLSYQEALRDFKMGYLPYGKLLVMTELYITELERLNAEYAHILGRTLG